MVPINTSVVSGVAISVFKDTPKILMMKRTKGNFWCHVAGSIEGSEKAWEAIIREFKEETRIEVEQLYSAEYLEQFYEPVNNRIMIIPVFVVICPENQPITLNEEHTEYRWCSLKEARKLATYPNQCNLYTHVWKYFINRKPSDLMKIHH